MSLPAISVRCPRCKSVNLVPAQTQGIPQQCVVCGHAYVVPGTIAIGPPIAGPLPPHLRSGNPQSTTHISNRPAQIAPPDDFTLPPPRPSRHTGFVMRMALLTIGVSLTVGLMLIPQAIKKLKQRPPPKPVEVAAADVVEIIDLRPVGGGPIQWIDAVRSAGLRSGMHVRITRCEFGEVAARDANGQPMSPPGEFLQIHLTVTNRLKTKGRYISWHGNQFRDGNEQLAARLTDDTGREYPPQRFSGLQSIAGHVDDVTLEPGGSINDVLIFALPAAKGSGENILRLQLPAAAVGRTGAFNFKLSSELWNR